VRQRHGVKRWPAKVPVAGLGVLVGAAHVQGGKRKGEGASRCQGLDRQCLSWFSGTLVQAAVKGFSKNDGLHIRRVCRPRDGNMHREYVYSKS